MMPTSASLDDWMNPLAALVASIRRDWDFTGIRSAISKARHRGTPLEVATALLKLARNEALRTPAMLASDGSHWGTPTVVPSAGQPRCPEYGHQHELAHNCRICAADAKAASVLPAERPRLTEAQAAANIQGARDVRAQYVRPAWLDTREDER
jgi:hypothetical protein